MAKKPTVTRRRKTEGEKESFNSPNMSLLSNIRIDIKHKNETQKSLTNSIKKNDVTICSGPAGTGKTYLTVCEALTLLKTHPELYDDIRFVKSVTQLKQEDVGILPGDKDEKLKYIMMSFFDVLYQVIGLEKTNKMLELGLIKLEVFGAFRGRSIRNSIIIVDEFQNITHDNAKTFLTRFSDNTKVIVLGDTGQIDLKNKNESSLEKLVSKVKSKPIDGVEVVEFKETDVVRHRLTSYFIDVFSEPEIQKKRRIIPSINENELEKMNIGVDASGSPSKFLSFFRNLFK